MPRYRLTVEYDGGAFRGWQRLKDGPSIQAALEAAVLGFTGEAATVMGAGRTDAGVHALGQVAHVDLARAYPTETVRAALNAHLRPAPVAVLEAWPVSEAFHARFDAKRRVYRYRILNRRAAPALDRGRVWHVPRRLDGELMHEAAQALVGRHDFTSFRSSTCQARSAQKTLDRLLVRRAGDEIVIEAVARSFLHHQVRNMVGSLRLVGDRTWPVDRVAEVLAARDRAAAGPTAPPQGLFLVSVGYDEGAGRL